MRSCDGQALLPQARYCTSTGRARAAVITELHLLRHAHRAAMQFRCSTTFLREPEKQPPKNERGQTLPTVTAIPTFSLCHLLGFCSTPWRGSQLTCRHVLLNQRGKIFCRLVCGWGFGRVPACIGIGGLDSVCGMGKECSCAFAFVAEKKAWMERVYKYLCSVFDNRIDHGPCGVT